HRLLTNSILQLILHLILQLILHLILGGAALQRCGTCIRFECGFSRGGRLAARNPAPSASSSAASAPPRENSFDRNIRIVRAARRPYLTSMATNTILSQEAMKTTPTRTAEPIVGQINGQIDERINTRRWQAVLDRDGSLDGAFVFGVSSTGIFCRPSCPAKRPRLQNVSFFDHALQAEQAGYRACLRCRPKAVDGNPQSAMVHAMCRYIEQHIEDRLTLSLLAKEFRLSRFHLQRTFKSVLGVSPKAYIDACRLRQVKQNLQAGHSVTTALYAAGYGSSSRLYERTAAQLGMTPEKYRRGAVAAVVRYTIANSPLGRMLIAATDKGICAIQFADSEEQLQQ